MTSIHYFAGGNVDARQRLLDAKLSAWRGGPVLHLVPTSGKVIELESDPRFWLKRRQDTLTGLIYKIFEENIRFRQFKNFRPIDNGVKSLIIKKAMLKRMSQPEGLLYFRRLLKNRDQESDFPGIFRAISYFFSQLVQNNYQDRFANELGGRILRAEEKGAPDGEDAFPLESDLAWLFGDYEEIKKEIDAYDDDDVFSSVRTFLSRNPNPYPVKGTEVIIFDGFIHLSKIEEDILYQLFNQAKEIWWPLDIKAHSHDPVNDFKTASWRGALKDAGTACNLKSRDMEAYSIFAPMAAFMDMLAKSGFETVTERCNDGVYLNPVAEGLYIDGRAREPDNNSLRIKYFPSRAHEVRAIAREIKKIIHEDCLDVSKDLGRIRIIFPELNEYSSLISEIFKEYGIPASLTRGLPLFSHPFSNIFLLMFKLPLDHFKRVDVFRLFTSELMRKWEEGCLCTDHERVLPLLRENILPGDDIHDVEALIRQYNGNEPVFNMDIEFVDRVAQKCGLKNFGYDSEGHDPNIAAARDFYRDRSAKSPESSERDELQWEYYRFIIQRSLLSNALNPFQGLIEQDTPRGIESVFSILLNSFGFPGNIAEISEPVELSNRVFDHKMMRRDLKAYSLLKSLVFSSASELEIDNELFNMSSGSELLSAFFRVFRNRLEDSYLLDEQDPNVIRISQWLEIRGRSFDYIFAGGLTDKSFPLKEEKDFIFPEPSRSVFRIPDSINMSRHLFSHLLRNYRKRLYLSCPSYADEKEIRPSNVFEDIQSVISVDSNQAYEGVEEIFTWEDSPYLSSEQEMLDSSIDKGDPCTVLTETAFPLKNIVIRDEYLLEGIIRGVRAMGSRWALDGLFEYDGLVGEARKFPEFLRAKKDVFSASQLEALANCPMRYLFERVYGLKLMEEVSPDATPMAMGEHIHGILSAFFTKLRDQRQNVSSLGIDQAFSLAKDVAEEYFKNNPFIERIEFFEHQKNEFLAGLENNASGSTATPLTREGAFALLLRFEEKNFKNRVPQGIEYEFGFNGPVSPHLGRVRLRGFIDRFDRNPMEKGRFYLYDYKTGSQASHTMIKQGLSFQLPIYIKALKACMNAEKISAALYTLKRDTLIKENPLGQNVFDHACDENGLDLTGVTAMDHSVDQLMELLEDGRFHHSADMVKCEYCDFRYACHRDERRMGYLVASEKDHGIYSGEKNLEMWKEVDTFRREWKKVVESMEKALSLKTASGRRTRYESVLAHEQKILDCRCSLPFDSKYIDELLGEIEEFKIRYLASMALSLTCDC
jgi:ATP-dependent helicase/DNAse subunit B